MRPFDGDLFDDNVFDVEQYAFDCNIFDGNIFDCFASGNITGIANCLQQGQTCDTRGRIRRTKGAPLFVPVELVPVYGEADALQYEQGVYASGYIELSVPVVGYCRALQQKQNVVANGEVILITDDELLMLLMAG